MPRAPKITNDADSLIADLLEAWRINNQIDLRLLARIPAKGFAAVPPGTRGRNIARQFAHLHKVRVGWLNYNKENVSRLPKFELRGRNIKDPTRAQLLSAFRATGKAIEKYLQERISQGPRIIYFGGKPVRWLCYMIAHESHHRGNIMLTLKLTGHRIPEKDSLKDVWMPWYFGKA